MRKSRLVIMLGAAIVLAGLGVGVLAHISALGTSARASMLPEAAAWMPSSASFVAYVDLSALLSSPLREQWEQAHLREKALSEVDEFRARTGMDPWTDFHALALSTRRTENGSQWGLALAGDLNPDELVSAIEEQEDLERSFYEGTTLYVFEGTAERGKPRALAFPSSSVALFGSPDYVRDMLAVGTEQEASVVEGPLAGWILELSLDDTFWCVGSGEVGFNRFVGRPAAEGPHLPPLQSFAISGTLGSEVSMIARGKASDAAAANKIADVVRGVIAMGSLQQQSRPEFQAILDSVRIEVLENKVEVFLVVPYETIRRLASHHKEADQ